MILTGKRVKQSKPAVNIEQILPSRHAITRWEKSRTGNQG